VESAAHAAARAAFGGASFARASADAVVVAAQATARVSQAAADLNWVPVQYDATASRAMGATGLMDLPLWPDRGPAWANAEWISLKTALPKEEDWKVWIDWYEDRPRGGSRGEAHELVFTSVPVDVWKQGPVAANVWISEQLADQAQSETLRDYIRVEDSVDARVIRGTPLAPQPLADVDSPFTYGWNANLRVEFIAGAQNLPFYPHFSSEEEHRHAPEVCHVGAERLKKSLSEGAYNVRREYSESLAYYLEDPPKSAGSGSILLANDRVRILHAMFIAEADVLPVGFASRLKGVIANQYALNPFYDLARRHEEAVNAGK
jgi:hypothetical protein